MLNEARRATDSPLVEYLKMPIEDIDFPADSFDIVISSLAFHYLASFDAVCAGVRRCLTIGGDFIFRSSIRCLPLMARKTGMMTLMVITCTGRWIITSLRGNATRFFWVKK